MRAAKSNDLWRRLFRRNDRKLRSIRVQFSNVTELGGGTLIFSHPINLICGENGVGKSAAIWTLVKALRADANLDGAHKQHRPKPASGNIDLAEITFGVENNGSFQEQSSQFEVLANSGDAPYVSLIDPGMQVPHLLAALRSDANLQDLVEGVQPIEVAGEELQDLRELAGKDYSAVHIYEIDDYGGMPVFPYLEVEYAGVKYNSLMMGLGEFSLIYVFWKLRSLPNNSVVLMEEPESFAAPRSQRALIDYLAQVADRGGHLCILSSHSGTIAERIPNEAIQLFSRDGQQVTITTNPAPRLLVDRIGLYLRRRFAGLVEDDAARAFCRALVEQLDPRVAADLDILISGSNGEISDALKKIKPDPNERLVLVGIYDGDQRNAVPKDLAWPTVCLPGETNPDSELRNLVKSGSKDAIAKALGIPNDTLVVALGGLEGTDDHDWTNRLCAALRITVAQLFSRLVPMWAEADKAAASQFIADLRRALKLV